MTPSSSMNPYVDLALQVPLWLQVLVTLVFVGILSGIFAFFYWLGKKKK